MKNIDNTMDPGTIYWRLDKAFKDDPLVQMLVPHVRAGLAAAFHDHCVQDGKIVLRPQVPNVQTVMRHVLRQAPLGWTGDEFKNHAIDVAVAALLPEANEQE